MIRKLEFRFFLGIAAQGAPKPSEKNVGVDHLLLGSFATLQWCSNAVNVMQLFFVQVIHAHFSVNSEHSIKKIFNYIYQTT